MTTDVDDIYQKQRNDVLEIFHQAMEQMHPRQLMKREISLENNILSIRNTDTELKDGQNIWVIGTGKASASMAEGLEEVLGDRIKDGMIIVPEGTKSGTKIIQTFTGNHPLPGDDSLASTYELIDFIKKIPGDDILLYCLSGGTSALLCMPKEGLELKDLQKTYKILLESGANIHEMNIVRKQLSQVKGGGLLSFLNQDLQLIDLVISDVPDNRLEDIGSAPTLKKNTGYSDVMNILEKYEIFDKIPDRVRNHLQEGYRFEGGIPAKKVNGQKRDHESLLLSSAEHLAKKSGELAEDIGYHVKVSDHVYNDDVRNVARRISADAISVLSRKEPVELPAALIYFGESTVNVTGNGLGGRNQELALRASLSIEGQHYITILSAGTDGRDGPTDAAGAISTSETALLARKKGLNPESYLHNNDSYHFFEKLDGLLITGPTGNNLMDLQIVLVTS
jgi:glycerate 2-kinase